MKIKNMPVKKEVEFSSLNDGDTFIYNYKLYMKMYAGSCMNSNAVSIALGVPNKFNRSELVVKVDGSFVVQSDCGESGNDHQLVSTLIETWAAIDKKLTDSLDSF